MARRHLEAVAHRKDGSFVLACSALTGRIWEGTVWVFSSMQDFNQCPNLDMVATRTTAGITDAVCCPGPSKNALYKETLFHKAVGGSKLPDETNLLLPSDSGELELWNCHPPGHTLEHKTSLSSHDDMALTVGLLAGGQKAVSGGADKKIIVWDIETTKAVASHQGHSDAVLSVATHPSCENRFISTSQDRSVQMWDLRKPSKPASRFLACKYGLHTCVTWCSTGENTLALGSESGQVEVLDMRWTSTLFLTYQPHSRAVHRLAFAPWDSGLLATVSDDTMVWIQSLNNRRKVLASSAHVDFVHGLSWHPSEPFLVTCSWDGQVLQHAVDISSSEGTDNSAPETDTLMEEEEERNA